jgi:hypothetical protein
MMNKKALLLTSLSSPVAFGYVTTKTPNRIFSGKPAFGAIGDSSPTSQQEDKQGKKRRVTYDLGLGKNAPVKSSSETTAPVVTNVYQAAKFWMIPEAVSEYPSPLLLVARATPNGKRTTTTHHTEMIVPVANRRAQDVLSIVTNQEKDGEQLTIFAHAPEHKLAVDTVWVELLIYHQQQQLQMA